jgi:hypothetical protein
LILKQGSLLYEFLIPILIKSIMNNTYRNHFFLVTTLLSCYFFQACKKNPSGTVISPVITTPSADTIPSDPSTASTIGFFMDNWQPKSFVKPINTTLQPLTTNAANVTITVNTGFVKTKIAPTYFGNNSNLWCGQLHTKSIMVNHLNNFQPRILRGPAGSVSDVYFFNANNNTPPASAPTSLLNANGVASAAGYWYGKNNESWTFSTDGYYDLLQQTNSIGLLTVNYGFARYGTGVNPVADAAHIAADWVRYDRGRTKYWEVGNENFGDWEAGYRINTLTNQDGQPEIITGALYGKHFKVFADSMRKAALETGFTIKIGAVIYDAIPAAWNTNTIKTWNSGYFAEAGNTADYYAVHNYFTPYQQNSTVATIFESSSSTPPAVLNYVKAGIASAGLQVKPIAMTEWNLFCAGSKQNVSNIAGVHSILTLGQFIENGYGAALRWDLANRWDNGDDHGLFSYGDEPGVDAWSPRPTFYYMYYFQKNTGDRLLQSSVTGSTDIVSIATSFTSGQKAIAIVNKGSVDKTTAVNFQYFTPGSLFYYYTLKGGSDNGDFSGKVLINDIGPTNDIAGGPANYTNILYNSTVTNNGIKITVPAKSVVYLIVDKK